MLQILTAKDGNNSQPEHDKTIKWPMRSSKTRISLGIRQFWLKFSLCALWVANGPNIPRAVSEYSDQTGRMPRLI